MSKFSRSSFSCLSSNCPVTRKPCGCRAGTKACQIVPHVSCRKSSHRSIISTLRRINFWTRWMLRSGETKLDEGESPCIEQAFAGPSSVLSRESAGFLGKTLLGRWRLLPTKWKALLTLLSRFKILPTLAEFFRYQKDVRAGIRCRDSELIANPYLIDRLNQFVGEACWPSTAACP
jgi:hypothetical protein